MGCNRLQTIIYWLLAEMSLKKRADFLFGYVNVYKDELKIREFTCYRAYYCGLCKQLGKSYNQFTRLGLNYDFAFLALLLDSLDEKEPQIELCRCLKHAGAKRMMVLKNPAVRYSADMSIILTYEKLLDDLHDDHSIKAAIAVIPYWFAMRRAKRRYGQVASIVHQKLLELAAKEKKRCGSLDEIADVFASLMEAIFKVGNNDNLLRLGYNIGRFIYILDAYDDREEDGRRGRYNPVTEQYGGMPDCDIRRAVERSLTFTLAAAAEAYQKLDIKRNQAILENILYMGMRGRMDTILNRKDYSHGQSI